MGAGTLHEHSCDLSTDGSSTRHYQVNRQIHFVPDRRFGALAKFFPPLRNDDWPP